MLTKQLRHSKPGLKKLCCHLLFWSALSLLMPANLPAQNENGMEVPVFAEKVTTGIINRRIETSGDILPLLGVNVHPEAAGRITEIFVDVGSKVKKG